MPSVAHACGKLNQGAYPHDTGVGCHNLLHLLKDLVPVGPGQNAEQQASSILRLLSAQPEPSLAPQVQLGIPPLLVTPRDTTLGEGGTTGALCEV